MVADKGLAAVARDLGLTRGVVSAALANTGVRKGSLELLSHALRKAK